MSALSPRSDEFFSDIVEMRAAEVQSVSGIAPGTYTITVGAGGGVGIGVVDAGTLHFDASTGVTKVMMDGKWYNIS